MARPRGRLSGQRSAPAVASLWLVGSAALLCAGSLQAQSGHLFTVIPSVDMLKGNAFVTTAAFLGVNFSVHCEGYCELAASAGLPHGARVVGIEIDACRDTAGDSAIHFFLVRQPGGEAPFQVLVDGLVNTTGCSYRTAVPDTPIVVDSFSSEYLVFLTIGSLFCGGVGQPACADTGTRFQAMRVYYEPNEGGVVEPSKRTSFSPFP
ncbi:MAG TPA: hypothetical protein VNB06_07250 [Thermoanaerobaculia bacterium]|nr:hypothetical protein [Thermoanaerobaculia bacterium]